MNSERHCDPRTIDDHALRQSVLAHVDEPEFPCVGAKSARAHGMIAIETAWSLTSAWDDVRLHESLLRWSERYQESSKGFRSLAFVFAHPCDLDEEQFEAAMWDRLQSFTDKDGWRGQSYDESVSSDPADPHFSLSFGQQAYFVVGMHPHASRVARRTPYPTLVFNLHDQFEALREAGRYERMRESILDRDVALAGSVNPMLTRHGEASEARQYSGRAVTDDWRCPYSDGRKA